MIDDDNASQMIFGDLGGLKLPDICLTGEEKPRKSLTQETCPDRGSNPAPLRDKRACWPTTVDDLLFIYFIYLSSLRNNMATVHENIEKIIEVNILIFNVIY